MRPSKRRRSRLRVTLLECTVGIVREADRGLAHEAAHQRREGVVAGDAELVLDVNHRLRRLHDDLLIVVAQLGVRLVRVDRLRDEVLQDAHYVRLDGARRHRSRPANRTIFDLIVSPSLRFRRCQK